MLFDFIGHKKIALVIILFLLINFFLRLKKQRRRSLIAKLLRIYYVRRLSVSYRMNVRTSQKMLGVLRLMLRVISNINHNILYSLLFQATIEMDYFFTFLKTIEYRLFLYFFGY